MRLTTALYRRLYRSFSTWAAEREVFKVAYSGGTVRWVIRDGVLWARVDGGFGSDLLLNLGDYTIGSLRAYIDALHGYSVPSYNTSLDGLSARALLDGEGTFGGASEASIMAYASLAWALLDMFAQILKRAETDVAKLPNEMDVTTAGGEWLDALAGDVYGIRRLAGEIDRDYAARWLREVLTVRNNNIAIGEAIRKTLQISAPVSVVDVVPFGVQTFENRRSHGIKFDGQYRHGPRAYQRYCEFDVAMEFDLVRSPDPSELFSRISRVVEQFRAAGTRLRSFAASGGLSDVARPAVEVFATVSVAPTLAEDTRGPMHDGAYTRNGSIYFGSTNDDMVVAAGATLVDENPFDVDDDMELTITTGAGAADESL